MKSRLLITAILCLSFLLFNCKKSDTGNEPNPITPSFTIDIIEAQNDADDLLTELLAVKDTASALDSLLKTFLKDSNVVEGKVNSQGIFIRYKNGIISGIMIDPEDGGQYNSTYKSKYISNSGIEKFSPTSKNTIFINPSYYERADWADQIISLYNTIFPKAGYSAPVLYLNEAATIARLTSLSGYGIVHIYSHGWAYPDKWNIQEVYLMTGEKVNAETDLAYENEIKNGNIPLIKTHKGDSRYYISPAFFAEKNNFSKDSSVIYGGFCYSYKGNWPNSLINTAGTGAYTGFTWRVLTGWNSTRAMSLFDTLTNNQLKKPRDLNYWFTQTPDVEKIKYDPADKVNCIIKFSGRNDLTIWEPKVKVNIEPNPAYAATNEYIAFTAKTNDELPSGVTYKWDFGDGSEGKTTYNDSTTTYAYTSEGEYTVSVKLYDNNNKMFSETTSQAVISNSVKVPVFSKISIDFKIGAMRTWQKEGKYYDWDTHTLRDTSYGRTDSSWIDLKYPSSMYDSMNISSSGSSFYGQKTENYQHVNSAEN